MATRIDAASSSLTRAALAGKLGRCAREESDAYPPGDRWRHRRAAVATDGRNPPGALRRGLLGLLHRERDPPPLAASAPDDGRSRVRARALPSRPGPASSGRGAVRLRRDAGD